MEYIPPERKCWSVEEKAIEDNSAPDDVVEEVNREAGASESTRITKDINSIHRTSIKLYLKSKIMYWIWATQQNSESFASVVKSNVSLSFAEH